MSSKFQVYFTKAPERENPITLSYLMKLLLGYFKKVFWYAKAQILRRKRSYRSMFVVSIVMLSFVFINLILNEAHILSSISAVPGGAHHIMFYGVSEQQAKGAAGHRLIKDSIIIPVIATMESSVDSSTVGKVAVLTDDVIRFMQIGVTHGNLPEDNEIIVPRNIYSRHSFLILGKEQDMYFDSAEFIYRSMSLGGLYNCTDEESPYVFVNEKTGAEIQEATGNEVVYDVFLTITVESDRSAATLAGEIIHAQKILDTEVQAVNRDADTERRMYRDFINIEAAGYRVRNELDENRVASMGGVVIAALIMASFMTNYTERHVSEYGILAAYGAKRRHLFGVVIGQVLFITVLSMIPVVLISMGAAWLYTEQYNAARLEFNLPVIMQIPQGNLVKYAIWYILILTFLCSLTMKKMLSQFPYPMVRGSTAAKIPFVRNSSRFLEKAKDKVRHAAFLQSIRQVKRQIIPALATSVICIVCAAFVGNNLILTGFIDEYAAHLYTKTHFAGYDGYMGAADTAGYEDGFWRGYVHVDDLELLASLDGVKAVGGIRTGIRVEEYGETAYLLNDNQIEMLVTEDRSDITDDAYRTFYSATHVHESDSYEARAHYREILENGAYAKFTPYYCDPALLPFLVERTLDGDVNRLYTEENGIIIVDNAWKNDDSHYHAGDTLRIRKNADAESIEVTVCAVISGNYVEGLDVAMVNGCVILSAETGEKVDGFPAELRKGVYFTFDDGLTDAEYQALCDEISNNVSLIRYKTTFYETERLQATKMETLENAVTAAFFVMLYVAMCVLDYYHSSENILAQRKEFCTLRQMGASEKAIKKTTRTDLYVGQLLSIGITVALAIVAILCINGYCANLANMYRFDFAGDKQVLAQMLAMVKDMQVTYCTMTGLLLLGTIPLHGLALLTAVAGTVLPTRQILKENIAQTLKGSAEL